MIEIAEACESFVSRRLFYPSSGDDVTLPVATFLPFINEFWFIDTCYSLEKPLLDGNDLDLRYRSTTCESLSGTTLRANEPFEVQIRHETYLHTPTGREIVVNACRGRGYDVFRAAFRKPDRMLSVFFHRGDSGGEGGSGFYWLGRKMIKQVFDQLEKHAVLVSDGSNTISELSTFHCNRKVGQRAVQDSKPFTVRRRRLECVAYLGERYGPTLAWKCDAAEPVSGLEPE